MDAAMLIENNSWIFTSDIQLVIKILAIEAEEDKGADGGEGKLEADVACQEGAGSISQVKGVLFISHESKVHRMVFDRGTTARLGKYNVTPATNN